MNEEKTTKRYIRAENGKIYDTTRWKKIRETHSAIVLADTKSKECEYLFKSGLKESDKLDELCDGFVYARTLSTGEKIHEVYKQIGRKFHAEDEVCELIGKNEDNTIVQGISQEQIENGVYGAIWTTGEDGEPIFKSVAKMNSKGDLELL